MMRARAFFVVLALSSATARADLSAAAKARLETGLVRYNAGQFEAAIDEIEAAYEIDADPSLLFTWAQAERLAGRCDSAVPRYRRFIASRPSTAAIELANNGIGLCAAKAARDGGPRAADGRRPWYQNPVGGAVVAGVLGLGVGTGFLIAASGTRDRADRAPTSDAFERELDRATTQRRIGATFLVVGAGLVGGGIAVHLWTTRSAARTVVGTTGSSLFIAGEF